MLDFQLFRIKVFPPRQLSLVRKNHQPQEILIDALNKLPSAEGSRGIIWHIGNIEKLDQDGYYFRFGKTTKSTFEVYENGLFKDEEFETSPYTHIVIHTQLELCGIARKTKLSQTTKGIANQLARVLTHSQEGQSDAKFEIATLLDPKNLIHYLTTAYSISKFMISFKRPNPWDIDEDYVKPTQKLLESSGGEKGKTQIEGNELASDKLEDLARSAASTGDEAIAWLRTNKQSKLQKKQLTGNPVIINHEDLSDKNQITELYNKVVEVYNRIRNGND